MAYIDKELFKQDIKMRYCNNCARPNEIKCRACHIDDMLGEIEDAPTADVAEVVHGEWSLHPDGSGTCNRCGRTQKSVWDFDNVQSYCGKCGAKMDRERKESME